MKTIALALLFSISSSAVPLKYEKPLRVRSIPYRAIKAKPQVAAKAVKITHPGPVFFMSIAAGTIIGLAVAKTISK